MTRKDYELIAEILSEVQAYAGINAGTVELTARMFADRFRAGNTRFDRERFLLACGVNA